MFYILYLLVWNATIVCKYNLQWSRLPDFSLPLQLHYYLKLKKLSMEKLKSKRLYGVFGMFLFFWILIFYARTRIFFILWSSYNMKKQANILTSLFNEATLCLLNLFTPVIFISRFRLPKFCHNSIYVP